MLVVLVAACSTLSSESVRSSLTDDQRETLTAFSVAGLDALDVTQELNDAARSWTRGTTSAQFATDLYRYDVRTLDHCVDLAGKRPPQLSVCSTLQHAGFSPSSVRSVAYTLWGASDADKARHDHLLSIYGEHWSDYERRRDELLSTFDLTDEQQGQLEQFHAIVANFWHSDAPPDGRDLDDESIFDQTDLQVYWARHAHASLVGTFSLR